MSTCIRVLQLLLVIAICLLDGKGHARTNAVRVTVDTSSRYQVMDGFGSSVRVWDDPHVSNQPETVIDPQTRARILDKLYGQLKLNRARFVYDAGMEIPIDSGYSHSAYPMKFRFAWKRNDSFFDYAREASRYGEIVIFPSPLRPEPWMRESNPDQYVDWVMAILMRWRAEGKELPYFSILNEPSYSGNTRSSTWPPAWFTSVIRRLGQRMHAQGLKTRIVMPDDLNACVALPIVEAVLQDPEARRYVGAVAFHNYEGRDDCIVHLQALAQRYNLPLWMTEHYQGDGYSAAFAWGKEIHQLITQHNVAAVDYMWGFFGDWERDSATLIALSFPKDRQAEIRLLPTYFVTGHYSRFIGAGDVRVRADSSTANVLASAYLGKKHLSVVLINDSGADRVVSLKVLNAPVTSDMKAVLSDASRYWTALPTSSADGALTLRMSPYSVVTLSNAK